MTSLQQTLQGHSSQKLMPIQFLPGPTVAPHGKWTDKVGAQDKRDVDPTAWTEEGEGT